MVVTNARLAQCRFTRTRRQSHGASAKRDAHERFEEPRHIAIRKPEVSVTALLHHADQAGINQFGQVRTCSGARDAGVVRKLSGRKRAVRHEHGKNLGTRLVADERGNACNVRPVAHAHMLAGGGLDVVATL